MPAKSATTSTKDVALQALSREELTAIASFDDALAALQSAGVGIITEMPDIGDGFNEIDKAELVGVPFLIVAFDFREGDLPDDNGNKGEYVGVRAIVRETGDKVYFSDGSGIGVYTQLKKVHDATGQLGGVLALAGLDHFKAKIATRPTYFIAGRKV